jgi:hypothetical protein
VSGYGWVSLIALSGWLVLAAGSYRAHRVGKGRTVVMAMAWLAIFLLVTGIFAAMSG